jgi:transposase
MLHHLVGLLLQALNAPVTGTKPLQVQIAIPHDRALYRQRHKIEIMFGRLKDWRRIHTRYD